MDEAGTEWTEPGRMDPPRFEDRHPFLDPQQGLGGGEVLENEAGPAGVAGKRGEEFGEDRTRRLGHGRGRQARFRTPFASRTGTPAGDEMKTSFHTTHNAHVLLLFLFARVREQSQSGDSRPPYERCGGKA